MIRLIPYGLKSEALIELVETHSDLISNAIVVVPFVHE